MKRESLYEIKYLIILREEEIQTFSSFQKKKTEKSNLQNKMRILNLKLDKSFFFLLRIQVEFSDATSRDQ